MSSLYIKVHDMILDDILKGRYKLGQKMPTEAQLMEMYGCSRQTIRNALAVLEDEKYVCRKQGSGTFLHRSDTGQTLPIIAVIITRMEQGVFPQVLKGIERIASPESYSILLNATRNGFTEERTILESIMNMHVDGILVEGTKTGIPNPNLDIYRVLMERKIPIVFFNRVYMELFTQQMDNVAYVNMDEEKAAYEMTVELIKLGCTRIGGVFKSDDILGIQRYSGCIKAMMEYGISVKDDNFLWVNAQTWDDFKNMVIRSSFCRKCDGVVCFTDNLCRILFDVMDEEISTIKAIRSFDGTLSRVRRGLNFKSVSWDSFNIGEVAAEKLIKMIHGGTVRSETLFYR